MNYREVLGQIGSEVVEQDSSVSTANNIDGLSGTLLTTEVLNTQIATGSGIYIVEDETNNNSAVISFHNVAGVPTPTIIATDASITVTADNAATINVYFDAGGTDTIVVQNLLAGTADVRIKAYK